MIAAIEGFREASIRPRLGLWSAPFLLWSITAGLLFVAVAVPVVAAADNFANDNSVNEVGADADAGSRVALSRIGFVDIPYLIGKAPQAIAAEKRLEAEFAPRQSALEGQRAELASLAARLADSTLEFTDSERMQLDRETRGLERRVRRSEQDFREELNIQKNNEFKKVRILVLEAIAEFGKHHDYDLIVSDGVLFANQRIDVTERILDSLARENARLQSSN